MREKKYTRTIAVRVTAEEMQLIEFALQSDGHKNTTAYMRELIERDGRILRAVYEQNQKRKAAAEKRAATKAAKQAQA